MINLFPGTACISTSVHLRPLCRASSHSLPWQLKVATASSPDRMSTRRGDPQTRRCPEDQVSVMETPLTSSSTVSLGKHQSSALAPPSDGLMVLQGAHSKRLVLK